MPTPEYNYRQVLQRVYDKVRNALRVFIVNSASDPIYVVPTEGGATTTTIYNVALGPVNTEQSQALPSDTKEFTIKSRNNSVIKLAYNSGESGTNYIEIKKNAVYTDKNLYTSQTIYFQSPSTGDVVEIVAHV